MGNQTSQLDDSKEGAEGRKALFESGGIAGLEGKITVTKKGEGKFANAKPVHLAYFAIRALGELPRLVLEVSGHPYVMDNYGFSGFSAIKGKLPGGKLPVLYNFDGRGGAISQSAAITRTLALKTGLAGSTPAQQAKCDYMFETYKDLFKAEVCGHKYSAEALLTADPAAVELLKYTDMFNSHKYSPFVTARAAVQFFEDTLPGVGGQEFIPPEYLCGPFVSYVDLAIWQILEELEQQMPQWATTLKLPKLHAMKERIDALPSMLAYLSSYRLMPAFTHDGGQKYKAIEDKHCAKP